MKQDSTPPSRRRLSPSNARATPEQAARALWDEGRDFAWTEDAVSGTAFVGTGTELLTGADFWALADSLAAGGAATGSLADARLLEQCDAGLGWVGWLPYEAMRDAMGVPGRVSDASGPRFLRVRDGVRFTSVGAGAGSDNAAEAQGWEASWVGEASLEADDSAAAVAAWEERLARSAPGGVGHREAHAAVGEGAVPDAGSSAGLLHHDPRIEWATGRSEYLESIADAQAAITEGEVFVLCLTTRATVPGLWDGLESFLALRRANPTRHLALLRLGDTVLVAASPERFIQVDGAGRISTHPIKGTRPRHGDPVQDAAEAAALAADPKERAENVMVVDVARNDLHRVCQPGTVRVERLWGIDSYEGVHQLVSEVAGTLRPGASVGEVLRALAPGCSMTGAPKHRAVQLIEELEPAPRGVYSGAFGTLGVAGTLDLAMAIRCAVITPGAATVGVGGGITADSVPAREWDEVLLKAGHTLGALRPLRPSN